MSFVAMINSHNITSSRIVSRVRFIRMWDLNVRRDSARTYDQNENAHKLKNRTYISARERHVEIVSALPDTSQ